MRDSLFLDKSKYKFFLVFHIFISILYFLFAVYYISIKGFKERYYLYLLYLILNLFLTGIIYYKFKYTRIVLNIVAVIVLALLIYSTAMVVKIYTNTILVNFLLTFEIAITGYLIFYIIYLNKNTLKKNRK